MNIDTIDAMSLLHGGLKSSGFHVTRLSAMTTRDERCALVIKFEVIANGVRFTSRSVIRQSEIKDLKDKFQFDEFISRTRNDTAANLIKQVKEYFINEPNRQSS